MLHVAQDEFPKPIKVTPSGRTIAWFEDEVAEWQKARAAERDGGGSQDCELEASARCL
jgi:predicted DNA-binding transcriptional regulator AlpA